MKMKGNFMNKKIAVFFAVGLGVMMFTQNPSACLADNVGTTTASFLRIEQGARAVAMGSAFTGIADSADAVFYNPAGIAQITRKEMSVTYSALYSDIQSSFLSFVSPVSKTASIGIGVTYVTFDKIESMDGSGNSLGMIKPTNMAAAVYYSEKLQDIIVGGGIKFIKQDYVAEKGNAYAVDGGILYKMSDNLSLGAAVFNLGPKAKLGDASNKLPSNIRGGIGYKLSKNVTIGCDAEKPVDLDTRIHIGCEYELSRSLVARVGYQSLKDIGLTAGVGLRSEMTTTEDETWGQASEPKKTSYMISIDYAYVSYANLDATHRISAGIKF